MDWQKRKRKRTKNYWVQANQTQFDEMTWISSTSSVGNGSSWTHFHYLITDLSRFFQHHLILLSKISAQINGTSKWAREEQKLNKNCYSNWTWMNKILEINPFDLIIGNDLMEDYPEYLPEYFQSIIMFTLYKCEMEQRRPFKLCAFKCRIILSNW